jgi:hypothetical protein
LIRVERGAEVRPGEFAYTVPQLGVSGVSRQPLLDACRKIQSLLGLTGERAGLFRDGRSEADCYCGVAWGAAHTVKESPNGPRFAKFQEFPVTARPARSLKRAGR